MKAILSFIDFCPFFKKAFLLFLFFAFFEKAFL